MLNYIWGGMLLIGIAYSALTGALGGVTELALGACKSAVSLAITMVGVVALWSGLMRIAEESGLVAAIERKMEKPLGFLFPRIPKNHPAMKYIATNFIANILGLGWAATPAGLNAMRELSALNRGRETASNEMCLFLTINISSLQLISVNLLAYRAEYNSANPAEIIFPGIVVTCLTTLIGIIVCKIAEKTTA